MAGYAGKRFFDLAATVAGIIVLSPLLVLLTLAVRIFLGRPVLFRQVRPGLHGRPFTLLKFRSMTDARDDRGELLPDEQRMTRFGNFLRSSSLDELPEIINVLKGDMSLVGPRPLLMEYLDRYSPEEARRHEARPGITGWAQVNGRNAISWAEKFRYDLEYVESQSFGFDIKILLWTVMKVFRREGISAEGCTTSPEFMGHGPNSTEH